jgi:hypothetical protein
MPTRLAPGTVATRAESAVCPFRAADRAMGLMALR